jgi:hypothetical protein
MNNVTVVLDGPGASVYEVAMVGVRRDTGGIHGSTAVTRVACDGGRVLWRRLCKSSLGWQATPQAAAVAPNGDIVVAGQELEGFDDGDASQWFVCRLRAADGKRRWRAVTGRSAGENGIPFGVAVDAEGSAFVSGVVTPASTDPAQRRHGLLVKYDQRGKQLWTAALASAGDDSFEGVAPDGRGGVFVTGQRILDWKTKAGNCYLRRYNESGVCMWTRRTCGGIWSPSAPVLAGDRVYVSAFGWSTWADQRPFVKRFTARGALEWTRYVDGLPGDVRYASDMTVDAAGDVVIAGGARRNLEVTGAPDLESMGWVAKLHRRTGRRLWTSSFYNHTGDAAYDGAVYALAADGRGRVYLGGIWSTGAEWSGAEAVAVRYAAATGSLEKTWVMGHRQAADSEEGCFALLAGGHGVYAGCGVGTSPGDWSSALYRLRP